ncbi:ferredoxin reductase [Dietzia sp.]|uniref:ferredoxin reductase n=1 Tax=Dietzia sp. TaxID=1871616 RepID=UPI002FD96BEE
MTNALRRLATAFTTPLFPEDYATLLDPLRGRELRGRVESVERHEGFTTLHIKPGPGIGPHFHAGQFVGIGLQVEGRFVWRSYSLTSAPGAGDRRLSISIKPLPDGLFSGHLAHAARPGQLIRLTAPSGEFYLPVPLPEKIVFLTAGAGITPVVSMLRWLAGEDSPGEWPEVVHIHSERAERPSAPYGEELAALAEREPRYTLVHWDSRERGRVTPESIVELVPDVDGRAIFACGPSELLDAVSARWPQTRTEKFFSPLDSEGSEGGEIEFGDTGVVAESNGTTTILEAGEAAGLNVVHGCRMGICRTCVSTVDEGVAVDLRDGTRYGEGEHVRTCVSVPSGHLKIRAGSR